MTAIRKRSKRELLTQRRRHPHGCWDHLIAAVPWPLHGVNLGTLLRTCEAAGACLAVPRYPWIPQALNKGYTAPQPACVHWIKPDPVTWLGEQHQRDDTMIIGVELCDESIMLGGLKPARKRTIMVLGHEQSGIPDEALDSIDYAVEIPMLGTGTTLNVAVAGSMVLYRLAGLM